MTAATQIAAMHKLQDKVCVITGGNSGIGLATAKRFAEEGARVVIAGRNQDTVARAVAEIGRGARGFAADVTSPASLDALYGRVGAPIDVLVANAGIVAMAPLEAITEAEADRVLATNYKGVIFTLQRALPHLSAGASVIVTSSTVAHRGIPGAALYISTKAAELALVRVFAAELAPRRIRVNALSPGSIATPIFANNGLGDAAAQMEAFFAARTLLERNGTVDEMARGFVFLASEDSAYMTGGELLLDGGFASAAR